MDKDQNRAIPILLVTANVGSIFEEPELMLEKWVEQFIHTILKCNPMFVALHCQEVGGKNYEGHQQHVVNFVKLLTSSKHMDDYNKLRMYVDEDFTNAENYTALGNFYFIHKSVEDILIWNFKDLSFEKVEGAEVFAGNIDDVATKEKAKYPQNFFPECKWSRKGYLRTRWSLNGTIFDVVNLHLFHDASNFIAMQDFPSVYAVNRQRALQHTLDKFYNYSEGSAPMFLFGDFNFRTDTQRIVKKLTDGLIEKWDTSEPAKLLFIDEASGNTVLTLSDKCFSHANHDEIFGGDSFRWMKQFDRELDIFGGQLYEYQITFPPSYPFEENPSRGSRFMTTRCPSWCDRILLTPNAQRIVKNDKSVYEVIGGNACMGDHKPVYLRTFLKTGAGRTRCELGRHFCRSYSSRCAFALVRDTSLDRTKTVGSLRKCVSLDIGNASQEIENELKVTSTEGEKFAKVSPRTLAKYYDPSASRFRSASFSSWRTDSRLRLKSDPAIATLPRIKGHHSSSEEEWFEEVDEDKNKDKANVNVNSVVDEDKRKGKKNKKKDKKRNSGESSEIGENLSDLVERNENKDKNRNSECANVKVNFENLVEEDKKDEEKEKKSNEESGRNSEEDGSDGNDENRNKEKSRSKKRGASVHFLERKDSDEIIQSRGFLRNLCNCCPNKSRESGRPKEIDV